MKKNCQKKGKVYTFVTFRILIAMDKKQTIGIMLISVMLLAYMFLMEYIKPEVPPTSSQDSTQVVQEPKKTLQNLPDSLAKSQLGDFATAAKGIAQDVVLENKDMRLTLSTEGGIIKEIFLKNHLTFEKKPLILTDSATTQMSMEVQTSAGKINLKSLFYEIEKQDEKSVVLKVRLDSLKSISQVFSLQATGFELGFKLQTQNMGFASDSVKFSWAAQLKRFEKNLELNRSQATVNYLTTENDFDYLSETSMSPQNEKIGAVKWVAFKQKYFNSAIISENSMGNTTVASEVDEKNTQIEKNVFVETSIALKDLADGKVKFYFGANDYDIAETVADDFENNVYLGWAVFKPITVYIIKPLFRLLEGITSNYGLNILILVLIIKSVLFPLTYKSYLSMARMKVLKPELDAILAKHNGDVQKAQPEQMQLYSQAGVNPLSGCIPVFLQMPVLLAMFNFFPNIIDVRQKEFLWADDLSSYDTVWDLGFSIPFYGDHVSLFTLLWAASTILYTYYNQQMTPTSGNNAMQKQMKIMSYSMPVVFLFMFNSFSAALTYYYCISNLITVAQQLLIKFFVKEDKLKAILDANRDKNQNKKKSSFQQRLEDAMKAQEEARKNRK